MEILIPIFGIVFSIGLPLSIPIVYFILDYRKRKRLMELHHAERMAAIERGMELPPLPSELLFGRPPQRNRSTLLPALIWLFIGIAITIATRSNAYANEYSLFGLVPVGVGLAYLIYYTLEGRKLHLLALEEARRKSDGEIVAPSRPQL
jgi:Domain of unknown function (DUF6249)